MVVANHVDATHFGAHGGDNIVNILGGMAAHVNTFAIADIVIQMVHPYDLIVCFGVQGAVFLHLERDRRYTHFLGGAGDQFLKIGCVTLAFGFLF